jgi:uridine kinase
MNPSEIAAILHQRITPGAPFIIGIDGCGGSGKSVLADHIARELMNRAHSVGLIQMDDFYLPEAARVEGFLEVGAGFDWRRLEEQVLKPATKDQPLRYQRYDWATGALAEWHESSARVVMVEGIYSTRVELEEFYDSTIWVECRRAIRLTRGLERDGESARDCWLTKWMPEEDRHVSEQSRRRERIWFTTDRVRPARAGCCFVIKALERLYNTARPAVAPYLFVAQCFHRIEARCEIGGDERGD